MAGTNPNKSKLVLGTAQLGMKYGLNNSHGQPSQEESLKILDDAWAAGINTFDTALAYGSAEEILGHWIKTRGLAEKVSVISKLKPHILNDYPDGSKATEVVAEEVEKSLNRLNLKQLDGYLLHSPHYIYLNHVVAALRRTKEAGLVKNIGVSVYDEAEAIQAADLGVDYVQIPYNIFDTRLERTNFFELAGQKKITVFARSPFLQGLLLMTPTQLPPHLAHAKPYLDEFVRLSAKCQISPAVLALTFVLVKPYLDHIVFGVETTRQLQENISVAEGLAGAKPPWLDELSQHFRDMPRAIVSSSLWSKIKPIK